MADTTRRTLESAASAAAAGAVIGSFIPGIGTLIGAGIGGLYGAVSGAMSANEENAQLSQSEDLAKKAINDATAKLETANAEQKAALEEFINGQKDILAQVQSRKKQLAEDISKAELGGIAKEEEQIGKGYEGLLGAIKQQEGGLDVVRQLQLEGIRQREALLGTEEAAARRVTAPGGLLERQQQQNALARAQAMQKARLGGPAARAALMGQFATQGAQLGMQAQQDIADAQRRVREGRMGLIGEQTSAELERQRGLMDIYGRRGELEMDQAKTAAGFTGRRTGVETTRLQGLSDADVGYQTGLGDLQAQRYNTLTDLRNRSADIGAGQIRDLSDAQLARLAREQELNAAASQRNTALVQSAMGLAAANPKALGGNLVPDWASSAASAAGSAIGEGMGNWLSSLSNQPLPSPTAMNPLPMADSPQTIGRAVGINKQSMLAPSLNTTPTQINYMNEKGLPSGLVNAGIDTMVGAARRALANPSSRAVGMDKQGGLGVRLGRLRMPSGNINHFGQPDTTNQRFEQPNPYGRRGLY